MIESYTETRIKYGEAPPPQDLKPGDFWVLVGDDGAPEAVDFLCPCGCGRQTYTPVVPEGTPKPNDRTWTYKAGPTLDPSIRFESGCKANFNITDGKTIIHSDSGK